MIKKSTKIVKDVSEVIDISKYESYTGELQTYFETGLESISLIVYNNDPKFLTKNISYNPRRSELGPEFFQGYAGMTFLEKRDLLFVENTLYLIGPSILYSKYNYQLSAFPILEDPSSFDLKEWFKLFNSKTNGTIYRKKKNE